MRQVGRVGQVRQVGRVRQVGQVGRVRQVERVGQVRQVERVGQVGQVGELFGYSSLIVRLSFAHCLLFLYCSLRFFNFYIF